MIQKRKNIKTLGNLIYTQGYAPRTNRIALCLDAVSITYQISNLSVRTMTLQVFEIIH
jgi:hypothetical protein